MPATKTTLTVEQRQTVDSLIKTWWCRMFEVRGGRLYLLVDHWKLLNWKKESKRVLLCKKVATKDGYYYNTDLV